MADAFRNLYRSLTADPAHERPGSGIREDLRDRRSPSRKSPPLLLHRRPAHRPPLRRWGGRNLLAGPLDRYTGPRRSSMISVGSESMESVLAVVLAGGKGSRLEPLTARPGQAGGALRRCLSHHRFHAFQLPQQRHSQDAGAHAIQGDEPRSAYQSRLAALSLPRAGRVHRRRAAAAADRRALVSRHRRRRLSEYLHAGKRTPRVCRDPGRRPHLQDGLLASWSSFTSRTRPT